MSRQAPHSAANLPERPNSRLIDRWRADAAVLRNRGALSQAAALESCAAELEQFEHERQLEALTLEQAVAESGYSYSALQKIVREGRVTNAGTLYHPRIRRCDLPKKPSHVDESSEGKPDLAERVLAGKG